MDSFYFSIALEEFGNDRAEEAARREVAGRPDQWETQGVLMFVSVLSRAPLRYIVNIFVETIGLRHGRNSGRRPGAVLAGLAAATLLLMAVSPAAVEAAAVEQKGAVEQGQPPAPVPPQGLVHIVPFGNHAVPEASVTVPFHLAYFGGQVISNVHVIAVFWGPSVNPAITADGAIDQFFTDITASRYFDLLTEYNTTGVTGTGGASSNQTIGRGTFGGKFTITPSLCPGPAACTITDAQIQSELASQITAGHLPAPVNDAQGNANSFYMIYFPPGVTINLDGFISCQQFCAYHGNTLATLTPKLVPYGVLPDFAPPSGCSSGCGLQTLFQNVTMVTSHELSESVTDALVGSVSVFGPPLAWYDFDFATSTDNGEIGDICTGHFGNVTAGQHTYAVQSEFSNLQNGCVFAPPVFQLNAPGQTGPGRAGNVTLTIQDSRFATTLAAYLGTVHFTSTDAAAVLPADYTFTAGDAGARVFSITLNTLGNQTISVTDTHSAGFNGSATVNVNTTPDLAITGNHVGDFRPGQTGATYTIVASNVGGGATSGTVTVTDTLPAALTATAFSGTGWSCVLGPPAVCTRSDVLAAGSSYPSLSLTVNVGNVATSVVSNIAAVSGGGDVNAANNSASDPIAIGTPDLTVFMGHANSSSNGNFVQGQTGAAYTILVNNVTGTAATSGTVTLVDTLPAGMTATAISGSGWSCTLATLTCTRNDILSNGSTFSPVTLTVNVDANAPASLTNVATVSGGAETDTTNDIFSDPTTITPAFPDLTVVTSSLPPLTQGDTGVQLQIAVLNQGFLPTSGTVTLSQTVTPASALNATAMSGAGWSCAVSTLSCTRTDALPANSTYPAVTLTFDVALKATGLVSGFTTVSGGGDGNLANNNIFFLTQANPLIGIVPFSTTATVTAGQAAMFEIVVTKGSAAGALTLGCSGLPAGASCSFNPASVTASNTPVTITVSTTAAASAFGSYRPPAPGGPLPIALLSLAALMALIFSGRRQRLRKFRPALAFTSLALLVALAGCGGGSSTPPIVTRNPGTPAGTYNFSATLSSAKGAVSQGLTLTVK